MAVDERPVLKVAPGLEVVREAVTEAELEALGVDPAAFPGSDVGDFKRYPVLSEGGWYMVVKHQPSLTSVIRTPWKLLGPVELTSEGLSID